MPKITHEEAKESLCSVTFTMHKRVTPKSLSLCEDISLDKLSNYINQQEKVEELLKLYQKYFKLNDIKVIDGGHTYGDSRNTKESIIVIEKIKEIEEELE
jgi:hypothetical protein